MRHRHPLRLGERRGDAVAEDEPPGAGGLARRREQGGAILHQDPIRLVRAIPFDEREFRMVQRALLAIAERTRELEDPPLAGSQQLLAGELRGGAQIARHPLSIRRHELGRERVEVRLVAGRRLQDRGLDLDKIAGRKAGAHRSRDTPARHEQRPAIGMDPACPKRRSLSHRGASSDRYRPARKSLELGLRIAMVRAGIRPRTGAQGPP